MKNEQGILIITYLLTFLSCDSPSENTDYVKYHTYYISIHRDNSSIGDLPVGTISVIRDANEDYIEEIYEISISECDLVKDGYELCGWNTKEDLSGIMFPLSGTFNNDLVAYIAYQIDGYMLSERFIDYEVVEDCLDLYPVWRQPDQSYFTRSNGNNKLEVVLYVGDSNDIVIPETINEIEVEAIEPHFERLKAHSITSLEIQARIEETPENMFSPFIHSTLTNINFPDSLKKISAGGFRRYGLETMQFPASLEIIGESSFTHSNLKYIEFPASLTTLEEDSFSRCWDLESVTFNRKDCEFFDTDEGSYNNVYSFWPGYYVEILAPGGGKVEEYANKYGFTFVETN